MRLRSMTCAGLAFLWTVLSVAIIIMQAKPAHADLLVSAYGYSSVLRYDERTGNYLGTFIPAHSGGLQNPTGIVYGPDGNLYVCDAVGNQILRYDGMTGAFLGVFGSGGLSYPNDLTFGPDGNLYVTNGTGVSIMIFDGRTGAYLRDFVPAGGALTFGPDGNLYVTDRNKGVLRYNGRTGEFIDVFVPHNLAGSGQGLVFGPDGNLYVADAYSNTIRKFNGRTGASLGDFASDPGYLWVPDAPRFGPDGNLYVASNNYGGGGIQGVFQFNGTTGAFMNAFTGGLTDLNTGDAGLYGMCFMPIKTSVTVADAGGQIGQTVTLSAVLQRNSDNATLPYRTLHFYVGNTYLGAASADSTGTAYLSYKVADGFSPGTQTIKVVRFSNADYFGSTGTGTLTVSAADTSVTVADTSGAIGQTITLNAVLRRTSDNAVLPGRQLLFYVGSSFLGTANCDSTGTAHFSYKVPDGFLPGSQTITVKRLANNQYNASQGSGTLTVTAADASVAVADVSGQAGQTVTLSAVLSRTSDNTVLPGRQLLFYVGTTFLGAANCDSTGMAQISYTIPANLSAGTQLALKVVRLSNSQYNGSTGFGTLTVTP